MPIKLKRNGHERTSGALGAKVGALRTLSGVLVRLGLRVEQVALERPSVHKKMNHPLGGGWALRCAGGSRLQNIRQSRSAQPGCDALDCMPAVQK